jgi:hypothetical protein
VQNGRRFEVLSGRRRAGKDEDSRADDCANAQRGKRPGAERLFQAMLGLLGFGNQPVDGLAAEKLARRSAPARFLVRDRRFCQIGLLGAVGTQPSAFRRQHSALGFIAQNPSLQA